MVYGHSTQPQWSPAWLFSSLTLLLGFVYLIDFTNTIRGKYYDFDDPFDSEANPEESLATLKHNQERARYRNLISRSEMDGK